MRIVHRLTRVSRYLARSTTLPVAHTQAAELSTVGEQTVEKVAIGSTITRAYYFAISFHLTVTRGLTGGQYSATLPSLLPIFNAWMACTGLLV